MTSLAQDGRAVILTRSSSKAPAPSDLSTITLDIEKENVTSCLKEVYHLVDEPWSSHWNQIFPQAFTAELYSNSKQIYFPPLVYIILLLFWSGLCYEIHFKSPLAVVFAY